MGVAGIAKVGGQGWAVASHNSPVMLTGLASLSRRMVKNMPTLTLLVRDGAGLNPDLSDPEPELVTITLYTHTHPTLYNNQQIVILGLCSHWIQTVKHIFQNVLEVLTFHSVP